MANKPTEKQKTVAKIILSILAAIGAVLVAISGK